MHYFISFTIVLSVVLSAFTATASTDNRRVCLDHNSPPDAGITACTALISSGNLKSHDLAGAYNRRGYFYLKKGESDHALADLNVAVSLDQDDGILTFLTSNWAIIIGGIGGTVGWYLTYQGWVVSRRNNSALEVERYQNAIDLEKRKAKLNFVSDQIRGLYGPLLALCKTRRAAFDAMMSQYGQKPGGGKRRDFFDGTKRTLEELHQWRLWRTEVLMPIVEKMQEVILQNAHLIDEKRERSIEGQAMPDAFLALMEHVAAYKAVIKNWADLVEKGEEGETGTLKIDAQQQTNGRWRPVVPHTAPENFPEEEILGEVEGKLKQLKKIQRELIETIQA